MTFQFGELEDLLVCPGSRTRLIQDGNSLVCLDPNCRLRYAILDDIPIMLVDEATALSVEEWGEVMQRHLRDRHSGKLVEGRP